MKVIAIILLTLSACKSYSQDKIILTLHAKDSINRLPRGKDDWFVVNFLCTIKNNSKDTIYFVDPNAYKIFPHPWVISVNGQEASFWPGDIRCAPSFKKRDIIKLAPDDTVNREFDWHTFISNFSERTGKYTAKVKYSYIGNKTMTMGESKAGITELKKQLLKFCYFPNCKITTATNKRVYKIVAGG